MIDFVYKQLVQTILDEGEDRKDRTGIGTRSIFDYHFSYNMRSGCNDKDGPESEGYKRYPRFPLLSGKKINFNNVMHELNWFLRGETNIKTLKAPQLWKPWAMEDGRLGPIYGYQWRHDWGEQASNSTDQITNLIKSLKENPYSRRHLVSAWNVDHLDLMALPPCHFAFICYVSSGNTLNLKWYQRSVDVAVGLPYNMASYALLLKMLAQECGLKEGKLVGDLSNVHIYHNHIDKIKEQINRPFKSGPELTLNPSKSFWGLVNEDTPDNYRLDYYSPHPFIKYDVAV